MHAQRLVLAEEGIEEAPCGGAGEDEEQHQADQERGRPREATQLCGGRPAAVEDYGRRAVQWRARGGDDDVNEGEGLGADARAHQRGLSLDPRLHLMRVQVRVRARVRMRRRAEVRVGAESILSLASCMWMALSGIALRVRVRAAACSPSAIHRHVRGVARRERDALQSWAGGAAPRALRSLAATGADEAEAGKGAEEAEAGCALSVCSSLGLAW